MLDESQLDEFLDEFFGEEKTASDAARLKNSGKQNPFHRKEVPSEELEEYSLPSDGMIIRQMERQGKVSRRTWFAFAVMLIVVPILLFFSVKIWGGRKYLLCSLIVVIAAMLPFFMMFEGRKPKAREIMVISDLMHGELQLILPATMHGGRRMTGQPRTRIESSRSSTTRVLIVMEISGH